MELRADFNFDKTMEEWKNNMCRFFSINCKREPFLCGYIKTRLRTLFWSFLQQKVSADFLEKAINAVFFNYMQYAPVFSDTMKPQPNTLLKFLLKFHLNQKFNFFGFLKECNMSWFFLKIRTLVINKIFEISFKAKKFQYLPFSFHYKIQMSRFYVATLKYIHFSNFLRIKKIGAGFLN